MRAVFNDYPAEIPPAKQPLPGSAPVFPKDRDAFAMSAPAPVSGASAGFFRGFQTITPPEPRVLHIFLAACNADNPAIHRQMSHALPKTHRSMRQATAEYTHPLKPWRQFHRLRAQNRRRKPHHNQATIGSNSRSLEIDPQGSIEPELKGLILCFTHWVSTSEESLSRLIPHEYR